MFAKTMKREERISEKQMVSITSDNFLNSLTVDISFQMTCKMNGYVTAALHRSA